MSCITTYTGKRFDPVSPDPERIDIRDIAHALSLTCRGNGHVQHFYSVAQHCISCANEALARGYGRETALVCLLHDASEAYMSDVPRPFKAYLSSYIELESKLLDVIFIRFLGRVPSETDMKVMKLIDDDMLWFDLKELLLLEPENEKPIMYADHDRTERPFADVEAEYLNLYVKLTDYV